MQKIGENNGETHRYDITGRICENMIDIDYDMPKMKEGIFAQL